MAIRYTQQMRQVTAAEMAVDDAVTVRALRDLGDAVNNAKVILAPRWSIGWPGDHPASPFGSEAELAVLRFPPWFVSYGYNRLFWSISSKLTGSPGGGDLTTWRFYWMWSYYAGPETITAALLAGQQPQLASEIEIDSTSNANKTALDLVLVPPATGFIHPLVTAQNAGTNHTSILRTLSATCGLTQAV